jgi:excisionase family DNA binding protein
MGTQTFYTVPEVAQMVKLTADHIYRVTKSGELGTYKIGRKVLISQEQLDAWLTSKRQYTKYERTVIAETYVATH